MAHLNFLIFNVTLDACREADNWKKQAIQVEVLKHSLNRMTIDTKGNAGHTQIQAAADHILCCQEVLVRCGNMTWNTTCKQSKNTEKNMMVLNLNTYKKYF